MSTPPVVEPVRTALVLVAGKSTRIQAAAPDRPKPLIIVAGETVLERNLRALAAAGVRDVWLNLHYRGEQIQALVGDGARYGLRARYSWEPELLGTAGAARKLAAELGDDTFFVVYGDNLTRLDLAAMTTLHRQAGALATIAVFHRDRTPNTGLAGGRVVLGSDEQVHGFVEAGVSDSPYVNAAVYLLEPAVLESIPSDQPSDFGRDIFPALIARGARVMAYPITGYCLGIDTPEGLRRAEALLAGLEARQRQETPGA